MGDFSIISMCLLMFLGSYAAGCIPLFFSLNERKIRIISVIGTGLLIGTALSVIIPEGISTLYSSSIRTHSNTVNENLAEKSFAAEVTNDTKLLNKGAKNNMVSQEFVFFDNNLRKSRASQSYNLVKREIIALNNNGIYQTSSSHTKNFAAKKNTENYGKNPVVIDDVSDGFGKSIGLSLTVGFLFMFIIDNFSKMHAGRNKSIPAIGLIIHAAADGIAIGGASTSSESKIQLIVFFAIMIHKGPAAFALTSILILDGLEKFRIRKHLLIFSLAAPVGTIFTYLFLQNIEVQSLSSTSYGTGVILLFSGGTFLYISAAHILPELTESKVKCNSLTSGSTRSHFSVLEAILFVLSSMFPFFFASHH